MPHRTRHEQRAVKARKDPHKKAWGTKRHIPNTKKDTYEKDMNNEVDSYLRERRK